MEVYGDLTPLSTTLTPILMYLHDFSEFDGGRVSAEGRFEYPFLAQYWQDPDRHPFLIMADDGLAGFALVKKGTEMAGEEQAMDVAEFFVLRSHRRKGIGRVAFRQLVHRFPGPWVVRVQAGIPGALAFWGQVIPEAADGRIETEKISDGGRDWVVFRFAVSRPSGNDADG